MLLPRLPTFLNFLSSSFRAIGRELRVLDAAEDAALLEFERATAKGGSQEYKSWAGEISGVRVAECEAQFGYNLRKRLDF